MVWIIGILILVVLYFLLRKKNNGVVPGPVDPHFWKWQQVDTTTECWTNYCNYMKKITSDTLVALEMKFYKWVSDWDLFHKLDY